MYGDRICVSKLHLHLHRLLFTVKETKTPCTSIVEMTPQNSEIPNPTLNIPHLTPVKPPTKRSIQSPDSNVNRPTKQVLLSSTPQNQAGEMWAEIFDSICTDNGNDSIEKFLEIEKRCLEN